MVAGVGLAVIVTGLSLAGSVRGSASSYRRLPDVIPPGMSTNGVISSDQAITTAAKAMGSGQLQTATSVQAFLKVQPSPPPGQVEVGLAPGVMYWEIDFDNICVVPFSGGPMLPDGTSALERDQQLH